MLIKFFVALTFGQSATCRKIQGFRQRFDQKFNHYTVPHMSLMAPFEVHVQDKEELIESLKDEIDNFFIGGYKTPTLNFRGLDVHKHKRVNILYLNPELGDDLNHCLEAVQQLCQSFVPPMAMQKHNTKIFLPIGHFAQEDQLQRVMPMATEEFAGNSDLYIKGISLFEKRMGMWGEAEELISFENPNDNFLQMQHASI